MESRFRFHDSELVFVGRRGVLLFAQISRHHAGAWPFRSEKEIKSAGEEMAFTFAISCNGNLWLSHFGSTFPEFFEICLKHVCSVRHWYRSRHH